MPQTCEDLKSKLAAAIAALEKQTPAVITNPGCTPTTPVGRLMAGLAAKSTIAQVDALAGLDAEQGDRLQALPADLGNDSARAARHLLAMHAPITALMAKLPAQAAAVSDAAAVEQAQAANDLSMARAAEIDGRVVQRIAAVAALQQPAGRSRSPTMHSPTEATRPSCVHSARGAHCIKPAQRRRNGGHHPLIAARRACRWCRSCCRAMRGQRRRVHRSSTSPAGMLVLRPVQPSPSGSRARA